jgi:hypothetical protein
MNPFARPESRGYDGSTGPVDYSDRYNYSQNFQYGPPPTRRAPMEISMRPPDPSYAPGSRTMAMPSMQTQQVQPSIFEPNGDDRDFFRPMGPYMPGQQEAAPQLESLLAGGADPRTVPLESGQGIFQIGNQAPAVMYDAPAARSAIFERENPEQAAAFKFGKGKALAAGMQPGYANAAGILGQEGFGREQQDFNARQGLLEGQAEYYRERANQGPMPRRDYMGETMLDVTSRRLDNLITARGRALAEGVEDTRFFDEEIKAAKAEIAGITSPFARALGYDQQLGGVGGQQGGDPEVEAQVKSLMASDPRYKNVPYETLYAAIAKRKR